MRGSSYEREQSTSTPRVQHKLVREAGFQCKKKCFLLFSPTVLRGDWGEEGEEKVYILLK